MGSGSQDPQATTTAKTPIEKGTRARVSSGACTKVTGPTSTCTTQTASHRCSAALTALSRNARTGRAFTSGNRIKL